MILAHLDVLLFGQQQLSGLDHAATGHSNNALSRALYMAVCKHVKLLLEVDAPKAQLLNSVDHPCNHSSGSAYIVMDCYEQMQMQHVMDGFAAFPGMQIAVHITRVRTQLKLQILDPFSKA